MKATANIILNGMPEVEKSTDGQLLAKRRRLSSSDRVLIQKREQKSQQTLTRQRGIYGFCQLEER